MALMFSQQKGIFPAKKTRSSFPMNIFQYIAFFFRHYSPYKGWKKAEALPCTGPTFALDQHQEQAIKGEEPEQIFLLTLGFSSDETSSLLKLRQHYQQGGSDRATIIRSLTFLRYLVAQGKINP